MDHAKILLESSFLSVKQIMTEVGIRDESHFVKDFYATYGLSPTRYRRAFAVATAQKNRVPQALTANSANR
jgi:transcriptional regulator GlxA family with amidase domain